MDLITHKRNKDLLLKDYRDSGKDLGTFALEFMEIYDDICYELKLVNATSLGRKVTGTALLGSCEAVEDFIEAYQIDGQFTVNLVDTQKEFFTLLEEIKKDIKHESPMLV